MTDWIFIRNAEESVAALEEARRSSLLCVAEGDDGGQTYFTAPANGVHCSAEQLWALVFDVDYLHWARPDGVKLSFGAVTVGERFGGGMGGALATDGVWIHEVMTGSALAARVEEVLTGVLPGLWPSGSNAGGRPNNPQDMLDLLEREALSSPAYDLIETCIRHSSVTKSALYANRLSMLLRKCLAAEDQRNRVAAAEYLIGRVDDGLIVASLYPVASEGTLDGSRRWQDLAVYLLGVLAKQGSATARESLRSLASSDAWIQATGANVFAPTRYHTQKQYSDPTRFRLEFEWRLETPDQPLSLSELPPQEVAALFSLAQDLLRQRRWVEAEPILTRFSEQLPAYDHGMVWYELAEVFEMKSDISAAEKAYLRAVECECNSIYLLALGTFSWRHGNPQRAIQTFKNLQRLVNERCVSSPVAIERIIEALENGGHYTDFARKWKWHSKSDLKEVPGPLRDQ